jgi:hypothetical protein
MIHEKKHDKNNKHINGALEFQKTSTGNDFIFNIQRFQS